MSWLNKVSLKRFFKRKPKVVKGQPISVANALGQAGIGVDQLAKTGSKKKRGRPKKIDKKKPGRPRKIEKKKRGRPRKIEKKKRGRPRKIDKKQ